MEGRIKAHDNSITSFSKNPYTCTMKIFTFLLFSTLLFAACNNSTSASQFKPIDVAMDSYRAFLDEFEEEVENAIAGGATSDEWEIAIQTLLSNSLESNNEIQRQWNKVDLKKGSAEYDFYLDKWFKVELKRFDLEEAVLAAWHNVEVTGLAEAMIELSAAEAAMKEELLEEESVSSQVLKNLIQDESGSEVESIREKLLNIQLESDLLFDEAYIQLLNRKKQLEANPASLVN